MRPYLLLCNLNCSRSCVWAAKRATYAKPTLLFARFQSLTFMHALVIPNEITNLSFF
uniref:Uncharacterized protein n=1 Tax=Picea glauca TaxID=3330 RepID=A0A117NIG4_PICGL|nr:hypothetical protein ABT39_MTgene3062 [Picea glauca]QHR87278.1 hypothetical protein Q903MT_gene1288 [Picea sitchensis]